MVLIEEEKDLVIGTGNYSGQNSMLNDNHIYEFNKIIKSFTNFSMQSAILIKIINSIRAVPLENEFLQILFDGMS